MKKIILASASASRKKHLERLKVEFEAITPQINEDTLKKFLQGSSSIIQRAIKVEGAIGLERI